VRPSHPLADRKGIGIRDLVRFAWVVPDESAHESLQRLASSENTAIEQAVIRCNASTLIKALLLSSEFIALVREDMARIDLKSGDYKELTLSRNLRTAGFLGAQRMGLVYRSNSALSRASQALIDEIKSFYKRESTQRSRSEMAMVAERKARAPDQPV
jgi:LysR family transcriptional regulator of gallate degradation